MCALVKVIVNVLLWLQSSYDFAVDLIFNTVNRIMNHIRNSNRRAAAMAHQAHTVDSKKRNSPDMLVVKWFHRLCDDPVYKFLCLFIQTLLLHRFGMQIPKNFRNGFSKFQQYISRKTVTEINIRFPQKDITTFDIPCERFKFFLQQPVYFLMQVHSFFRLFTYIQKPDSGCTDSHNFRCKDTTHHCKLMVHLWFELQVGTCIHQKTDSF